MARPIKLTEKLRQQAVEEFAKSLQNVKMLEGKLNYNKSFSFAEEEKARIFFTPMAYEKMVSLIKSFDIEVAWHGVGKRMEDVTGRESDFLISDILVYPQTVTSTTVEMDEGDYAKWIMDNIEDERFNNIIMQGHSHVNMGTSPSGVDLQHQESILGQLTDDMFYIFLIWNKKLETNTRIYDLANNIFYDDSDISYHILGEEYDLEGFMNEAKEIVKKKTYSTSAASSNKSTASTWNNQQGSSQKSYGETPTKGKAAAKTGENRYGRYSSYDDYTDYWSRYYGNYR